VAVSGLQGPTPGIPPQLEAGVTATAGDGLTVMVKVIGVPVQTPVTGVTVMEALTAAAVVFIAVKEAILPLPEAARPIPGLLFTQLNAAAVPEKMIAAVDALLHTDWLLTAFTVGAGMHCAFNCILLNNNRRIKLQQESSLIKRLVMCKVGGKNRIMH